ncbi:MULTISPECIES: hypothetical protein [Streptomyces]|uniref:hypothetical protein n=1 Tax=Streptomyces TaxID=1883 RepID=UPI00081B07C2|nr:MULTISPECIES: hypothetical protein [Streptomyces]MCX4444719.1 hypothetical protein [Streptomyces albidoflavus]SCE17042.1 hypothetical protein GA0115250_144799 [Streptomyces sp. BvitLS-983]
MDTSPKAGRRIDLSSLDLDLFKREWGAGTPGKEIARLLGIERSAVYMLRYKMGLPLRQAPKVTEAQKRQIRALREAKVGLEQIASTVGVEVHVVKGQLAAMGLSRKNRSHSSEVRSAVRRESEAGTPPLGIANKLGIAPSNVYRIRKELGLSDGRAGGK